jgi:lipoprotein-anchoring transpeptidase ErfK/SrfK
VRGVRRPLAVALGVAALAVAAAAGVVVAGGSSDTPEKEPALPPSPPSAIEPRNVPLGSASAVSWAPVRRAATLRSQPGGRASVAPVPARTPEGTRNVVVALGDARRRGGRLWVQVRAAGRPDDRLGWLPRRALGGYTPVRTRLVVDRERLTATLLRDGRRVLRAPIGIGRPGTPTPPGRFHVRNLLHRYRSAFYGPLAFGTSARSPGLSDWPAGGFVGIHGTNRPDLIPGRVSHGCIRLRNADIRRLARLMPVGTLLIVR